MTPRKLVLRWKDGIAHIKWVDYEKTRESCNTPNITVATNNKLKKHKIRQTYHKRKKRTLYTKWKTQRTRQWENYSRSTKPKKSLW